MQNPHLPIRLLLLCAAALALAALVLLPFSAHAQSISGVVNRYTKVLAIDECRNTIEVVDTAGFAKGDRVLIIQMAGAAIDKSNSKSYGTVVNMGSSGTFEIGEIYDIPDGVTIRLKNQFVKKYDASGLVQVIKIPQYTDATVSATLRPQPWDAGAGTGGVLVLEASGTLTLNADIDASNVGFAGGLSSANKGYTDTNFFDRADTGASGYKGDGVALGLDNSVWYVGGRGAAANGGGGGCSQNAGGGGGGNLTLGGQGGDQFNGQPPELIRKPIGGVGGLALNGLAPQALFMGGGGGGGHQNDGGGTGGGNGGGLIIIKAKSIAGSGGSILANGESVSDLATQDGAGGGGAGGTIFLAIQSVTGNVNLSANGGNGGAVDAKDIAQTPWSYGPGGGGSGGAIYVNNITGLTYDVAGGNAGKLTNCTDAVTNNTTYGAQAGQDGVTLQPFAIVEGNTFYDYPTVAQDTIKICQGDPAIVEAKGGDAYSWSGAGLVSATNAQETVTPAKTTTYDVKITRGTCEFADSVIVLVTPKPATDFAGPVTACTGGAVKYGATPDPKLTRTWTVMGGTPATGNGDSIAVMWTASGKDTIVLTSSNGQCTNSDTLFVTVGASVTPAIAGSATVCEGENDTLKADASYATYKWSTGETTPFIVVTQSGSYSLTATTTSGCEGTSAPFVVTQEPKPTVSITAPKKEIAESGETMTLTAPTGFTQYLWANQTQQLGNAESLVIDTAGTYYLVVLDKFGCSATDSVIIVQSLPIPDVALGLEDLHGFPGDKVTLHLKMLASHRLDSSGATQYRAYLRFNKSLLAPVDNFASTYTKRERIIEITGTRNDSIGVLGRPIDFMVALGDSDVSAITLDSLIWTNGKPVRTTLSSGSFHLDGICPAGGNRLFSSDGFFGIKAMAPNPTGGDLSLDYQLLERGRASLKLIDAIGRIAYTAFDQDVEPGAYHSSLDLHHLPPGVYTLVLQSASQREIRKIEVYR